MSNQKMTFIMSFCQYSELVTQGDSVVKEVPIEFATELSVQGLDQG